MGGGMPGMGMAPGMGGMGAPGMGMPGMGGLAPMGGMGGMAAAPAAAPPKKDPFAGLM